MVTVMLPAAMRGLISDVRRPDGRGHQRRVLVPIFALALVMHALVLLPIRALLMQEVSLAMAPPMNVRMVPAETANLPRLLSTAPVEPAAAAEATKPLVGAAPTVPTVAAVGVTPPVGSIRAARNGAPVNRMSAAGAGTTLFAGAPSDVLSPEAVGRALSPAPSPPSPPSVTPIPALPPAPAYLSGGKLDPGPRPLHDIEPVYPGEAHLREGSVVLRLLISAAGEVDDVAVVRSFPPGLFDASALIAFGQAKFSPGLMLGMPVKSQITIEVEFTPINRGATVSGRSY